ncbi:MAG: filamentous hemagglutinin N-terminal domain-containing protein, partial [Methylobacter sp.]|nr:filamentous hemagglutinin N-terminal domain-containing protein [Methylobacter sp.]
MMEFKLNNKSILRIAISAILASNSIETIAASEIVVDSTLAATVSGTLTPASNVTTINGNINGQTAGHNLFFSFSKFNLPNNTDQAFFTCSGTGSCATAAASLGGINNIISRVNFDGTNGASLINGNISFDADTLNHANFWFFNPQGVVIGSGASINVPGSFHVSNATQLSFPPNGDFTPTSNSTNVSSFIADPTVFGFASSTNGVSFDGGQITTTNGNIEVNATTTTVTVNGATTLTAGGPGTIDITGTDLIITNSGQLSLQSNNVMGINASNNVTNNGNITLSGTGPATIQASNNLTVDGNGTTTGI